MSAEALTLKWPLSTYYKLRHNSLSIINFFLITFLKQGYVVKTVNVQSHISYSCQCLNGFEMVNSNCVNIDECARETDTCDATISSCVDTLGSYECTCNAGYARFVGQA